VQELDQSQKCARLLEEVVAMEKGMYSQSIWVTRKGYTLVGFVSSDEEKAAPQIL
jgi:hypothetical protein